MNIKIFNAIIMICIVFAIVYTIFDKKNEFSKINKFEIVDKNSDTIIYSESSPNFVKSIKEPSIEVSKLNAKIAKDLGNSIFSKKSKISQLPFKQRNDSSDVIKEIENYYENIEQNQIEIDDLIVSCMGLDKNFSKLEKKISEKNTNINERSFNYYYFYQGLKESKVCEDLGSELDPFYIILESARKGHMLSQLLLMNHLYNAVQRKLINPWTHPLEYMNLRDEAISYLQVLAAKGVTRASVKLANIYSPNSHYMPSDGVLEYYYSFLAKRQEGADSVYVRDLDIIYSYLTDKEKIIVDRMTKNL